MVYGTKFSRIFSHEDLQYSIFSSGIISSLFSLSSFLIRTYHNTDRHHSLEVKLAYILNVFNHYLITILRVLFVAGLEFTNFEFRTGRILGLKSSKCFHIAKCSKYSTRSRISSTEPGFTLRYILNIVVFRSKKFSLCGSGLRFELIM